MKKKTVSAEVSPKVEKAEDAEKEEVAVKVEKVEEKEEEDKSIKKGNRVIWILMSIVAFLVLIIVVAVILIPKLTAIPDIKVPDVSNLTVVEAENKLKEVGFEVAVETEEEASETVEKGDVIRTSPSAGRSIKKGTTITIFESLGSNVYVMENFVGENYIEIQTILENMYGLKVTIEKKDVDDVTEYDEQEIIEQDKPAGTKLVEGDSVTLYIPNILEGYPDFVEDAYTLEDVQAFCDKYGVTLKVEYEETLQYAEGTVISQSRVPGSPIKKGVTLKVVIAKVPEAPEESSDPTEEGGLGDLMP